MIVKRIIDLAIVIPGLLVLSPVLVLLACWVKIDSNGPAFFRQVRLGKAEKIFSIFKFRTMVVDAESLGPLITGKSDSRITRSGHFLRKYKLDELPQLINVLKGEMSLVGPRPEVPEYVAFWPAETRKLILSVPPGITDYASIEFRNEGEILDGADDPGGVYIREIMPVKLRYYEKYVLERTIWLDFWLIWRTIVVIFR